MSENTLEKPVVVVLGAGGMGAAFARRTAPGRRLVLADYSPSALENTAAALRDNGHDVVTYSVDITKYDSVKDLAQAASKMGRLDAVIHSAGVSPARAPTRHVIEVDLLGTANVIEAFLAVAKPGLSVVCVASLAASLCPPLSPDFERHLARAGLDELLSHPEIDSADDKTCYYLSKRANVIRVQAFSRAFGKKGARINTVSPGIINTPMSMSELEGENADVVKGMIRDSAVPRMGTPEDVANLVAFLVSSDASYICGGDFLVDGGITAANKWHAGA